MAAKPLEKPDVIVCERSGSWAAALRSNLIELAARIRETRTLAECAVELQHSPAALVAVEVTVDNLARALHYLDAWQAAYPQALLLALLARGNECHEAVLREAGAAHVVTGTRRLHSVKELVHTRIGRRSARPNILEEVWDGLPWGD